MGVLYQYSLIVQCICCISIRGIIIYQRGLRFDNGYSYLGIDTLRFITYGNYDITVGFRYSPVIIDGINYYLDRKYNYAYVSYLENYKGDIVIPKSVVYKDKNYDVVQIYEDAFTGTSITSLTVSNGLNSIDLNGCDNLVALRANIDFIEGCSGLNSLKELKEIYITSGAKTFYEVNRNIPVYVAEVAYDDYVADQYWGEFFNIIPAPEYNDKPTNVENITETSFIIYTQGGMLYVEVIEADYNVFDASGRLIYTGRESTLLLPRGVYMIVVGNEVEKIVL